MNKTQVKKILKKMQAIFKDKNYELTKQELKDLEKQIPRKQINIYIYAIKYLESKKLEITYKAICKLIKDDIKKRNKIMEVFSSLEQGIRTRHLYDTLDLKKIISMSQERFKKYNKKKKLFKITTKNLRKGTDKIRVVRNLVSHSTYPVILGELEKILKIIKAIKNFDFIDEKVMENLEIFLSK